MGKGVLVAVKNVNEIMGPTLIGKLQVLNFEKSFNLLKTDHMHEHLHFYSYDQTSLQSL